MQESSKSQAAPKVNARQVIKFLASLKLAVVIMTLLAILIAVGTIVESKYDATAAKKWVYDTFWMYSVMGALVVSLTAVMVDRWPWQKRHAPFVLAHIGIIILLLGSYLTSKFGIDGSIRIAIGEKTDFLTLPDMQLTLWSSFDGDRYTKLHSQPYDFFVNRPQEKPLSFKTDAGELKIINYMPYTLPSRRITASESRQAGAAVQFQLRNDRVNTTEWLLQRRQGEMESLPMGPAEVILGKLPSQVFQRNQIWLEPAAGQKLKYMIFSQREGVKPLSGEVKEGESISTPWMGLQLQILRFLPLAEASWDFQELKYPTPITTAAIQVEFQGRKHWVQQNDVLKLFTENAVYLVAYQQQTRSLGFELFLQNFEIGRYQGSDRAASYASHVLIPKDNIDTVISMNEPLKHKGLTLYQASFQEGPDRQPVASILSVNYDPGRWLKYLGSLLISIGTLLLFYNKRRAARAQAPQKGFI